MPGRLLQLPTKIMTHVRLLRDDPEQFGRNLLQYTNPAKFEAGLSDVLQQPPLHVNVKTGLPAALNVLQPVLNAGSMTGGPNTVVLLAALVAESGVPVRIVTSRVGHRTDLSWFSCHMASLLGRTAPVNLEVIAGEDAAAPAEVGDNDVFLATHWTTAQAARPVIARMRRNWYIYLVQDFEPGFYAWSSNYALALESYALPHRAIINETLLAAHLRRQGPGLYVDPAFVDTQCLAFQPAVDRRVFFPPALGRPERKRLLFYARPTNARNMLGLGLQALRLAWQQGVFAGRWEIQSIGSRGSLPALRIAEGQTMRPAPWASYDAYADSLRQADVLLCPMLSPHTSYPVLEMAACGGTVVTNTYGPKTAEALSALSPDIIGVDPTVQGFVDGLRSAVARSGDARADRLNLPSDWDGVLQPVAAWAAAAVREAG